jgi:hypothetical protein
MRIVRQRSKGEFPLLIRSRAASPEIRAGKIFVLAAFAIIAGCAHATMHWRGERLPAAPVTGPIFVLVLPGPALPPDSAGFSARLLGIVREHDSKAELVCGNEVSASRVAFERGARHLLVATVLRWRDAQTQYSGEPDSISIGVRLMQLQPPAVLREFRFEAQGPRLAVRDAPADRLLSDKFRKAVRRLLASG